MSWKLMPMSPPQRGMTFDSKIFSDRRRKSRIQAGSFFISEICATILAFKPRSARNTSCAGVMKSYLLISPTAVVSRRSLAMVKPIAFLTGLQDFADRQDEGLRGFVLLIVQVL